MAYEEWNGYLVRKGESVMDCGFILPGDKKKYQKEKKEREQQKRKESPKSVKEAFVNGIKSNLARLTNGFNPEEKINFLRITLNVSSFSQVEQMKDSELEIILAKLRRID